MLKIVFAATPQLAVPSLEALHELAGQGQIYISALLTQADKIAGRRRELQPSAIKKRALELGLKNILTPEKLDAAVRCHVAELQPDLLLVFAYGKIFRQSFLDLFPLGGINLHPSALPQWRGPSPIEAQLLAGNTSLALSVQRLALKMDAGDILQQEFYPLPAAANYGDAAKIVAPQAAALLRKCCQKIARQGQSYLDTAKPQAEDQASYCHLIRKEDGRVNWNRSALQLSRQCRAYVSWPKAHTWLPWQTGEQQTNALQINILEAFVWPSPPPGGGAECLQQLLKRTPAQPGSLLSLHFTGVLLVLTGAGILAIRQLQRQNKNSCSAKEFANQLANSSNSSAVRYILPKWQQNNILLPVLSGLKLYHFVTI